MRRDDWLSVEPHEPPRPRRRRAATRAFRMRRVAGVLLCAILGSIGVAASMGFAMPEDVMYETSNTADPRFDAAEFYQNRFPARSSRSGGRATLPGQPLRPGPVAGLNQVQTDNAYIIVQVGEQLGIPRHGRIIAIATALQETNLRNLANPVIPSSLKLPHDGTGRDHDSLGLFQQRPSMGWGTVAQLMDPAYTSAKFYAKLVKIKNWQSMTVTQAAQAVQRSAFPGAYAKHGEKAARIVDALTR